MDFHSLASGRDLDPIALEAETLARIGMPTEVGMRHRSTHFQHIFSGGYSAGYYSYLWSEVLAKSRKPPALPGWQQEFDSYGSPSAKLPSVSRQAHAGELSRWTSRKPKSYEMGVQIPRHLHSEDATQDSQLRKDLTDVFRELARQRESESEEGHLMPDHVHMMISIPPKYSVLQVVGYIKGKSAIHIARVYGERRRNFVGQHFWARGYFVSTVGRDEQVIREYIRHKEAEDHRLEQMQLWR